MSGDVTDRPGRLTVGVVGAGRVGTVLAAALARSGHRVVSVAAVSDASKRRVAELLPPVAIEPPDDVVRRAELVLLAVPDDVLDAVVAGLAKAEAFKPGQLVVHTSGRYGLAALQPATDAGAFPLALHPAMTFTGTRVDLQRLTGCSFGVTTPEAIRPVGEALVIEMGAEPVWIPDEMRPLYHAALAHGANHLMTLVNETIGILRAAGVESPARMLAPLLGAALDNSLRFGDTALTGPVSRGDAGTVRAHLQALAQFAPEAIPAYVAMARATAARAVASGRLDPNAAAALLDVLAGDGART